MTSVKIKITDSIVKQVPEEVSRINDTELSGFYVQIGERSPNGASSFGFSVMGLGFMAFTAYLEHEAKLQIQEALMEIKAKQAIQLRNVQLSKQEKIEQRKQEIIAERNRKQRAIKKAEDEKFKQEAWLKIYKPRPDCETYTSDEHMVECVEYRSEQRRKFEAAYRKLNIN